MLCGALWPQPAAQQAPQRVSVSLLHMLAADLGAAFGAMAAVPPAGGARTTAASALGLREAGGDACHDEDANFNFDSTRKTVGNLELSPAAPPRRDTTAPREAKNRSSSHLFWALAVWNELALSGVPTASQLL